MGNIKNRWKLYVSAFVILLVFLLSRLLTLTAIPIFTDEAIYLRWAQIAHGDFDWLLISLTDGKQPLFIWLVIVVLNFVQDPLVAGRLVSVGSGIVSMVGLFFLSKKLFKNEWVGILAALLYVILPFALVYDRLAIYDSLVGALYIWGIYWGIVLTQKPSIKNGVIAGVIVGLGVLNKSSAFFAIYLLPFVFVLLRDGKIPLFVALKKWLPYALLMVFLAYILYNLQRISPFFYLINLKNEVFVYPLREWIMHPFTYSLPNLRTLIQWIFEYLTFPIVLLILGSSVVDKKNTREKILLLLYCIVPLAGLAVFAKLLYPRYIFLMVLPLLPLAAYTLHSLYNRIHHKTVGFFLMVAALFVPIYVTCMVMFAFENAPIPGTDKGQFLTGWSSGVGVDEAVQFLEKNGKDEKIFVGVGGQFGLLPAGLELYLHDNPNIQIVGYWPITEIPQEEVLQKAKVLPTYFIFYQPCGACEYEGDAPDTWPVEKVVEFKKPGEHAVLSIYKVNAN